MYKKPKKSKMEKLVRFIAIAMVLTMLSSVVISLFFSLQNFFK